MPEDVYDHVFNMAKRRGFVYPSYEAYGGSAGFYDYGPLGSVLKQAVEDRFRAVFVQQEGCAEILAPTVTPEPVLVASGHVGQFSDPVLRCGQCSTAVRADHLLEERGYSGDASRLDMEAIGREVHERGIACQNCGGAFQPPFRQNLMFRTEIGPGSGQVGYMRPETAQGIFLAYPAMYRYFRERLPFGVVQVGKAYRNEISPRQGVLRLREFHQMEMEYFFDPRRASHPGFRSIQDRVLTLVPNSTGQAVERTIGQAVAAKTVCHRLMGYWLARVHDVLLAVGIDPKRLRFRQHAVDEMAHYANDCWDAEFHSDRFGWIECVGVADRGAYDLSSHATASGTPMTAERRFPTPRSVDEVVLQPVPAKLGPLFRQQAKAVADALSSVPTDRARAWQSGPVTVEVDGAPIEVPPDGFSRIARTVTRTGENFVPHVVEPSFGVDRIVYALLEHCYSERPSEQGVYRVLRLPQTVAPVQVAVFPLLTKDGLDSRARRLAARLRAGGFRCEYDESGSIGRRYARADEVGVPYCVTVDHETMEKSVVTVRWRDTGQQETVSTRSLPTYLKKALRA